MSGSESYPTMQLTSASGSRGNGERGHSKVLQRLSGKLRIEKQPRSTVKVSPYPNRCDTTPLVPRARALVPLVYSSTPLNLQPHLPPIASPYRKELLLQKSRCTRGGTSLSVSHANTHACLLTDLHTRTRAWGAHFSPFQADPPVLHPFFPLTHTIWSMSLLSLTAQYPCSASA